MVESIYAENLFGVKSYYDLDVISRNESESVVIIKDWQETLKKLKFDAKKKCYVFESEVRKEKGCRG